MKNLVSTDWLEKNLNNVRIFDGSWHLPSSNRNALNEFKSAHIKNSNFFDIDKNSNHKSSLPHMLPKKDNWETIMSEPGVKNSDHIVIYDNSGVFSACRCWFTFLYFGHDLKKLSVLDGGLKKWKLENKLISNNTIKINKSSYVAKENKELVKDKNQIDENILKKKFKVIDARSKARFDGKEKEPREGIRSGSIPNSYCLPFKAVSYTHLTLPTNREV